MKVARFNHLVHYSPQVLQIMSSESLGRQLVLQGPDVEDADIDRNSRLRSAAGTTAASSVRSARPSHLSTCFGASDLGLSNLLCEHFL